MGRLSRASPIKRGIEADSLAWLKDDCKDLVLSLKVKPISSINYLFFKPVDSLDSRNPNTGFRLFLSLIIPNSTQIPP